MIAEAVRRSPLTDYRDRFAALSAATDGALSIRELPFVSQLNLRLDLKNADIVQRIAAALSLSLPLSANTVASNRDRRALWLGPDEWLIVGPDGEQTASESGLRDALREAFGAVTDVSANRTLVEIRGANAHEWLAHGVSIDLDPRSFAVGRCAQTLLAETQVVLERRDESGFIIYVPASSAAWATNWLLDAAADRA